jgi:predicted SAM-dependent methyltransferase
MFFKRRVDWSTLDEANYIRGAYHYLLDMEPDPGGLENYLQHLANGSLTRPTMVSEIRGLDDWWLHRISNPEIALHMSRKLWVKQLPKAARIIDLGGTAQSSPLGALVVMGYPYSFEQLTIVDLPPEDRHELYAATHGHRVESPLGPIEYVERSMIDLAPFADSSFDLVVSGQSIEHVTEADGDRMLAEAFRVLRPGGHLALDTPNRAATRIQLGDGLSNPDHKLEYTHEQLSAKLERAGFVIEVAQGMSFVRQAFETGVFSTEELAKSIGVYADIERCYFLAYTCRKP